MRTAASYSRTQIVLHWVIAALVLFQIFFHEGIEELWHARMRGTVENIATPQPHTIVGMLIGLLIIWRLVLRLRLGTPAAPAKEPQIFQLLSKAAHWAFYALLILMPISGAVAWFGSITTPARAHGLMGNVLMALIALHIAAALVHHFWWKTDVLKRIVGRA